MEPHNNTRPRDEIDQQVGRLKENLREVGIAPSRDLWPDIDAAISAEGDQIRVRSARKWGWSRIAATAAVITVLASAGWWGQQQYGGSANGTNNLVAMETISPSGSGLKVIDQALFELNQALVNDPDNPSLANLALMLQQSRGKALRQDTELKLKTSSSL